jgi:hypothetical protein
VVKALTSYSQLSAADIDIPHNSGTLFRESSDGFLYFLRR